MYVLEDENGVVRRKVKVIIEKIIVDNCLQLFSTKL